MNTIASNASVVTDAAYTGLMGIVRKLMDVTFRGADVRVPGKLLRRLMVLWYLRERQKKRQEQRGRVVSLTDPVHVPVGRGLESEVTRVH